MSTPICKCTEEVGCPSLFCVRYAECVAAGHGFVEAPQDPTEDHMTKQQAAARMTMFPEKDRDHMLTFLDCLARGIAPPPADRDQDRARQKCARRGLASFASGWWKITDQGVFELHNALGQDELGNEGHSDREAEPAIIDVIL